MTGAGIPDIKMWADPVTEVIPKNTVELWEFYNFTADAHPIHLHQVQFQVANRQRMAPVDEDDMPKPVTLLPGLIAPEEWESGRLDTFIAYPRMVTRIRVMFDLPGRYVWHCHILEHEDNEMMRPLDVV